MEDEEWLCRAVACNVLIIIRKLKNPQKFSLHRGRGVSLKKMIKTIIVINNDTLSQRLFFKLKKEIAMTVPQYRMSKWKLIVITIVLSIQLSLVLCSMRRTSLISSI